MRQLHNDSFLDHMLGKLHITLAFDESRIPRTLPLVFDKLREILGMSRTVDRGIDRVPVLFTFIRKVESMSTFVSSSLQQGGMEEYLE